MALYLSVFGQTLLMKNLAKTLTILSAFLFIGCALPRPISKLTTEHHTESKWVVGRQFVTKSKEGVSVTLAYYKNEGDQLIFDALLENRSDVPILANPNWISILSLNASGDTTQIINAIDPEGMLLDYDKEASRQEAHIANQSLSNLIYSTSDLVATVSDQTNQSLNTEERNGRYNNREFWYNQRQADYDRSEAYLESIKNTRLYWEEIPIRKTTVGPNEFIDGKLFFPRDENASTYIIEFQFPESPTKFHFRFKHELVKAF